MAVSHRKPVIGLSLSRCKIGPTLGSPENAGLENGGPKKSRGWKMQDWKMTDESAGLENARLENDGRKCRAGK